MKWFGIKIMKSLACVLPLVFLIFPQTAISQNREKAADEEALAFRTLFPASATVANPLVSRMSIEGGSAIVLDRSEQGLVLLQHENKSEVWALSSSFGPRGDEFLRNDLGHVVLRITALGGATFYSESDPNGKPASLSGRGETIAPLSARQSLPLQTVVERAVYQFNGHVLPNLRIEAGQGLPPILVQDALARVHDAVASIPPASFTNSGRRFRILRITRAPRAFVNLHNFVLEIGITPGIGYAGRPSSAAIRDVLIRAQ